jgi:3-phenylpropionate/cinnamic acid dioxygenase small subunit
VKQDQRMDPHVVHDRMEITDLLSRYARAVDTKDWALWRSVFTEDAHLDYRSAGGPVGGREEVGDWLEAALADFPMTQHLITNVEVTFDGDTATVHALFFNPMTFPGQDEPASCGGTYDHEVVRTSDGWKSVRLVERNAWFAGAPKGVGVHEAD